MSVKFGDFSGKVRYSKRMGPEFEKMKIFHDLQWNRIIVLKLMLGVPGKKEKRKIILVLHYKLEFRFSSLQASCQEVFQTELAIDNNYLKKDELHRFRDTITKQRRALIA